MQTSRIHTSSNCIDNKHNTKLKSKRHFNHSNTLAYISHSQKNIFATQNVKRNEQTKLNNNKSNKTQHNNTLNNNNTTITNHNYLQTKSEHNKIFDKYFPFITNINANNINSIYSRNKAQKLSYYGRSVYYSKKIEDSQNIQMKRRLFNIIILKSKQMFFNKIKPFYKARRILRKMLFAKKLKNRFVLYKRITMLYKVKQKIYMVLYQNIFDTLITKLHLFEKNDLSFYFHQPRSPFIIRQVSYINKQFNTTTIEYDIDDDDEEGNSVIITKKMEKTIIPKHSAKFNKKRKVNIYENKLVNSMFTLDEQKTSNINDRCYTERLLIKDFIFMKLNCQSSKLQYSHQLSTLDKQLQLIPIKTQKSFVLKHKVRMLFYKWKTFLNTNNNFIYHRRSNSCLNIHLNNNHHITNIIPKQPVFKKPKITNIYKSQGTSYYLPISNKAKHFTFILCSILHEYLIKQYFFKIKAYATFNPDFSIIELDCLNKSFCVSIPQIYQPKRSIQRIVPNNFIYKTHKPKGHDTFFSISKKETAEQTFLNNTLKYTESDVDYIDDINNCASIKYCHTLSINETLGNNKVYTGMNSKIKTKVIHFSKKI